MGNLNDMNNLYNAQDFILLCEIVENRFELMYNVHGYNPRKYNSTSSWSSCIARDLSKVITVLRSSNRIVEIFEKTISKGFSSVNTKLGFDTEILSSKYNGSMIK